MMKFFLAKSNKDAPKIHDHLETINLESEDDLRPIQINGLLEETDRTKMIGLL